MKQRSRLMTALVTALLVSATSGAQTKTAAKKPVHAKHRPVRRTTKRVVRKPVESATTWQMAELRDEVSGQQVQIDNLKAQLSGRDQQVAQAQQAVADSQAQIASAAAATTQAAQQSTQNAQDLQQLRVSVGDLAAKDQTLTDTVVANQAQVQQEINSPTTIHYKGVTIQPIGFFAFEGVWRQRSVNSDINTPFNTIPFPGSNEGHISELNFTGRQSRLGALFTGDAGTYRLAGYFEADFLGVGTASNNNQSNSYVFRQRQFWGQAENAHGFRVTGGQMWSLVTEDGHGTDNRTEILPNTVDSQYMVGFNWTRQPGVRFQQRFGDPKNGSFTLAMALEQAQITNFTAASTIATAVPPNFFFGGTGTNGGLYNAASTTAATALATYANNAAPDVIVKGAFDFPKTHMEFGGMARFFRDQFYPILTETAAATTGAVSYTFSPKLSKSTAVGGGVFGSIRVTPVKAVEVGVQAMAGPGVGRYGSTQLADATIKPDGELEPIRNYHGLFSLVTHEKKNLDIYAYYGGEYAQRTTYVTPTGATEGYGPRNLNDAGCYALPTLGNTGSTGTVGVGNTGGAPGTIFPCASPTRYMQEGMIGFTYRIVNSPKYGRLQYQTTYSLLQRNLWSGTTATATVNPTANPPVFEPVPAPTGPRAQDNMIHISMRYYIP